MALGKKERRITISVGLVMGVIISSLLVRHALDVKEEQTSLRPGNYNSLYSAVNKVQFPSLPPFIREVIPNGIVVFFEGNRTSLTGMDTESVNTWVIETTGSFRSERLFILAEVDHSLTGNIQFLRASEIYVKLRNEQSIELFKATLDVEKFRVIGKNSSSGEYIVQIKNFSPTDLANSAAFLKSLAMVESTRFSPWFASR